MADLASSARRQVALSWRSRAPASSWFLSASSWCGGSEARRLALADALVAHLARQPGGLLSSYLREGLSRGLVPHGRVCALLASLPPEALAAAVAHTVPPTPLAAARLAAAAARGALVDPSGPCAERLARIPAILLALALSAHPAEMASADRAVSALARRVETTPVAARAVRRWAALCASQGRPPLSAGPLLYPPFDVPLGRGGLELGALQSVDVLVQMQYAEQPPTPAPLLARQLAYTASAHALSGAQLCSCALVSALRGCHALSLPSSTSDAPTPEQLLDLQGQMLVRQSFLLCRLPRVLAVLGAAPSDLELALVALCRFPALLSDVEPLHARDDDGGDDCPTILECVVDALRTAGGGLPLVPEELPSLPARLYSPRRARAASLRLPGVRPGDAHWVCSSAAEARAFAHRLVTCEGRGAGVSEAAVAAALEVALGCGWSRERSPLGGSASSRCFFFHRAQAAVATQVLPAVTSPEFGLPPASAHRVLSSPWVLAVLNMHDALSAVASNLVSYCLGSAGGGGGGAAYTLAFHAVSCVMQNRFDPRRLEVVLPPEGADESHAVRSRAVRPGADAEAGARVRLMSLATGRRRQPQDEQQASTFGDALTQLLLSNGGDAVAVARAVARSGLPPPDVLETLHARVLPALRSALPATLPPAADDPQAYASATLAPAARRRAAAHGAVLQAVPHASTTVVSFLCDEVVRGMQTRDALPLRMLLEAVRVLRRLPGFPLAMESAAPLVYARVLGRLAHADRTAWPFHNLFKGRRLVVFQEGSSPGQLFCTHFTALLRGHALFRGAAWREFHRLQLPAFRAACGRMGAGPFLVLAVRQVLVATVEFTRRHVQLRRAAAEKASLASSVRALAQQSRQSADLAARLAAEAQAAHQAVLSNGVQAGGGGGAAEGGAAFYGGGEGTACAAGLAHGLRAAELVAAIAHACGGEKMCVRLCTEVLPGEEIARLARAVSSDEVGMALAALAVHAASHTSALYRSGRSAAAWAPLWAAVLAPLEEAAARRRRRPDAAVPSHPVAFSTTFVALLGRVPRPCPLLDPAVCPSERLEAALVTLGRPRLAAALWDLGAPGTRERWERVSGAGGGGGGGEWTLASVTAMIAGRGE